MKKWTTKKLVEAGIMIALSFILSQFKIYKAPNGGSVTAGSMIPIMIFAMRWGLGPGFIAGASFGILKMIFGGYILNPIQAILEYPIAFGVLGLAGIFKDNLKASDNSGFVKVGVSVFFAIAARFLCHLFAGIIFFRDTLPEGINAWIASASYQMSYLLPEFILSVLILMLVWKPISKID